MTRLFLDANVLFSAAYREDSGLRKLWERNGVRLVTSAYAVAEARTNLESNEQRDRLDNLLTDVETVTEQALGMALPEKVTLPAKDRPILEAAIGAGADYLVTGDVRHFGPYFGQTIVGVTILRPAEFLRLP